ncbi:MAG TPA: glycosyltransferase family 39 protein [Devosiaceae bacterium]|nr:glycosyltransferase family 39 protein [Devosiaceae bacterium]
MSLLKALISAPRNVARGHATPLLIALALTALALALRLYGITAQSLWWDEVSSFQQARLDWAGLLAATAADNYPPLHNILLHLSMQALGENALALRLPSALLGGISVLALYWAGTLIAGRPAALIAAALLCISGYHLWFSQEARMYGLLCLMTILFAGAAVQVSLTPTRRWTVASILAGTLLLFSHPYGALNWLTLVFAIGLVTWSRERSLGKPVRFALLQIPALLLFLPWALILIGRAKVLATTGFWIDQITPAVLLYYFETILTGPGLFLALLLGIALVAMPLVKPERGRLLEAIGPIAPPQLLQREALWLLLAWGFLPSVLGAMLSLLTTPMLFHRYLIGSLPALLLLTGMGFARLPKSALGATGALCLAAAAIVGLVRSSPDQRDDFRDVAASLATELRPGDCVVMSPQSAIAMAFYRPAGFACAATPSVPTATSLGAARPQRILAIANSYDQAIGWNTTALGKTVAVKQFGVTRLLLVTPN